MKFFVFFLFPFATLSLADNGGAVGNGGDSVYCQPNSSVSPFVGWYNLDYLSNKVADVQFAREFESVVGPNDSYDKNILRILSIFKEKRCKALYEDLKNFHDLLWSNAFGEKYQWKKAPYGVVEVEDERLSQQIPRNCLATDGGSRYVQTVLRHQENMFAPVTFTYSTEVVSKLPSLQLSFLLFHEWLRNFTQDPEVIRNANAVFHSTDWSGDDFKKKVDLLGRIRLDYFYELAHPCNGSN
jgi:hypothetical protein